MKKIFIITSALFACVSMASCQKANPILKDNHLHRDDEFGGAFIDISIPDFNKLGFKYGDSLSLDFSNGVHYDDIGYYSGYYVAAGQELVVAYPGYDYIKFCINYGDDVYTKHNFDLDTAVTITVFEKQKYKVIEETLSISYSDDISTYESPEEFANFREIKTSNIKPGLLYRGASPIDNRRQRATTVDGLLRSNEIAYDIDLADSRTTIDGFYEQESFASTYFKSLDDNNKVLPVGMGAAYKSDDFSAKLKTTLLSILNNEGPYYIHCLEGKDRTGYVCMIIEAMCGASYDDLVDDYFITYKNYYGIDKVKDSYKYEMIKSIHIDEMIRYAFDFEKTTNLLTANYRSQVDNYLEAIGLSNEELYGIRSKLMEASAI